MAKFIEPSYKILSEDFTRANVLKTIERAARTCYQSEGAICEGSDVKLLKKLLSMGHEAMIEHAPALSVSVTTCRGVTHEIVRNRLFSFAQESTRYVRYGKDGDPMLFILPPWIQGAEREALLSKVWTNKDAESHNPELSKTAALFMESCVDAETYYRLLLGEGWQPQQAREVLPNALKTEIVITGNVRQWRHFFELRCDKPAHPSMRAIMIPLFNQLRSEIPELWDDVAEKINLEM